MRLLFFLALFNCAVAYSQPGEARIAEVSGWKDPVKRIDTLNSITQRYWESGQYQKGLALANSTLRDARKNHYVRGEGIALNQIGIINDYMGNYAVAMKNYYTALGILEKHKLTSDIAFTCSNIGLLYSVEGRHESALKFHLRALTLREEIRDTHGISASNNNLGIVYNDLKLFDKALYHYNKSLEIDLRENNPKGLADTYNNLGLVYLETNQFDRAINYFETSERYRIANNDIVGQATEWVNLGITYLKTGKFDKAKEYFLKVLPIAEKYHAPALADFSEGNLADLYEKEGNYQAALYHFRKQNEIAKKLNNGEVTRKQTEAEMQYAFDKETARRKIEQAKLDFQRQKEEERTLIILWAVVGLLLVAGASAVLIFRRWKVTNAQKQLIEEKNQLVEAKNREILDSILYAKRIQKALLPSTQQIHQYFPRSFVLYKPKDIVAGDFYWIEKKGDTVFFAVGDCTGHGVPGALVSVVCINALNKAVLEYQLTDPAAILEKTRALVLEEFERSEDQVNDGMDIALIAWDAKNRQISYSGANNNLWLFRNRELTELKASKQPIGAFHRYVDFDNQTIQIENGDQIFLFTDGYADQFGGSRGKKFKSSRLKQCLSEISGKSPVAQCEELEAILEEWKGDNDQVDDICIAGIAF